MQAAAVASSSVLDFDNYSTVFPTTSQLSSWLYKINKKLLENEISGV